MGSEKIELVAAGLEAFVLPQLLELVVLVTSVLLQPVAELAIVVALVMPPLASVKQVVVAAAVSAKAVVVVVVSEEVGPVVLAL